MATTLETTTVNHKGLDFDVKGYFTPAESGSFNYYEGGCPDSQESFEISNIYINDVEVSDMLNDKTMDELRDLAIINLK